MKTIILTAILAIVFSLNTAAMSQELRPANQQTLDSIKQANAGNVILFNFWATWCKPCVEEFPDLIKLNEKYKEKNFKLVFVSLDFGNNFKNEVTAFLKKNNVDFVTYYNGFDSDEELINYMDETWNGGIPGTFIFDKKGNLKKTFIGKKKYEDFRNAIDNLN